MNSYVSRNAENEVIELSKQFPVVAITGPRQVGKSTLLSYVLRSVHNNINYVTLDNLSDRALAIEDPELFLETYKAPLIIDEFQFAPNLLSYIKIKVDNKRLDNLFNSSSKTEAMYYLTGSQSFLGMNSISESLAGRVGILDLYGLSMRELAGKESRLFVPEISELQKETDCKTMTMQSLFESIFRGSYPEVCNNNDISLEKYYSAYVKTYIERDIRTLINVKNEIKFMKFIISVAARTGCELNLNEIANDIEMTVPTVTEWLSILVNTGLVVLIEPYSTNIIKRVIKRPKIIFMDTGLACYLTKYPSATILESSAYAGRIFETYVISEIIKSFANKGLDIRRHLYYYRDNNANEIDLIIDYNDKIYPIEIKKSKNPNKDAIKNFDALKGVDKEIANGVVLCMIDKIYPIDKNNYYVPISYI